MAAHSLVNVEPAHGARPRAEASLTRLIASSFGLKEGPLAVGGGFWIRSVRRGGR